MKKNISINISGIIFHIEEDGYEILRKYLDSINRYFSSFEDNSEILSDIESRIAEILLSKLSEGKQVVTAEDVNSLMATMGSVNDFKAAEEQEMGAGAAPGPEQKQQRTQQQTEPIVNKKLFRDDRRKILGGVCSGLAHYFNIDPVWPRLLFALLAFATYGGLVVAYIILWIIIPASATLEDESTAKKMYRDTDNRIIGGVAAGLSAFFGIDSTVVRVIFIGMSIFGGLGIVVYIIMWIALPEAKTITDKMQMSGERITLSNIESSVKKGINEKDSGEESVFAKIILFPFRLIAMLIDALAKVLGPVFLLVVDIFRIGIGLCITLTGALLIFSLILAFGIIFGLFNFPADSSWNDWYVSSPNLPLDTIRHSFPTWTAIFAFLAAIIPAMLLSLLGASIISKKIVFNSYIGWSMFVLFFISVGVMAFTVPQIVYSFKEEGEYKVEKVFEVKGTPVLRINEMGLDNYHVTDLTIHRHDGKDLRLVQRFESQGNTRRVAAENAKMVEYNVVQTDSILTFDSNITFKKDAKFRAQRLDMELFVPVNMPFVIEDEMWRIIDNRGDRYNYRDREETATWRINEFGILECITCFSSTEARTERAETVDQLGLSGWNQIDIEGILDVTIEQDEDYAVEVTGRQSERYKIYTSGETLVIDYEDDRGNFWRRGNFDDHEIQVKITMPDLRSLKARGGGKVRFRGFEEDEVDIRLTGAIEANGGIDARDMDVEITGACSLDLAGTGTFISADITGASSLSAYGYQVRNATIEARGASTAKVYVTERLEYSKGVASSVSHRGDPEIVREN